MRLRGRDVVEWESEARLCMGGGWDGSAGGGRYSMWEGSERGMKGSKGEREAGAKR